MFICRKPVSRNALKLGGKSKDVDSFVDQLKNEGESITSLEPSSSAATGSAAARAKMVSDVHTERFYLHYHKIYAIESTCKF